MPSKTIYVDEATAKRMEKAMKLEQVNWSAICRKAIVNKCIGIEGRHYGRRRKQT